MKTALIVMITLSAWAVRPGVVFAELTARDLIKARKSSPNERVKENRPPKEPSLVAKQGFRPVTVRVDDGGSLPSDPRLLAETTVDVISSFVRGNRMAEGVAEVIVENAIVLAVDKAVRIDNAGRPLPGILVTLALQPDEAVTVAAAEKMGMLSIALCRFRDGGQSEQESIPVFRRPTNGLRAHTFRADLVSKVGARIPVPGSTLDVNVLVKRGNTLENLIVAEDVLLVALDSAVTRDNKGSVLPGVRVTLGLKPEDMLRLTLALELGRVSVTLRRFRDLSNR
jgi:Flp pilus assembly protein CpaB